MALKLALMLGLPLVASIGAVEYRARQEAELFRAFVTLSVESLTDLDGLGRPSQQFVSRDGYSTRFYCRHTIARTCRDGYMVFVARPDGRVVEQYMEYWCGG